MPGTELQRELFAQVVSGTPSAESTPIDYNNIISNPYDPLASVNESISTNMDPDNDVLDGIKETTIEGIKETTTIDLKASTHEIDEHYQ